MGLFIKYQYLLGQGYQTNRLGVEVGVEGGGGGWRAHKKWKDDVHCLSSLDRNYIEYSGSSCKQTTSGHEKGVSKWSWPLARMVL